jgi:hypothetical protein
MQQASRSKAGAPGVDIERSPRVLGAAGFQSARRYILIIARRINVDENLFALRPSRR